jgi:hypothetical protein
VRSWIHAEGPLARNSWFGYECVVADAVECEPVSEPECAKLGKILGKTYKLPRFTSRNSENACGMGTSEDSELEK